MKRVALSLAFALLAAACGAEPEETAPAADEAAPAAEPEMSAAAPAGETPGCWLRGATAEEAGQRSSPRDSASVSLAGGQLEVCYGGPSARGRTIVGELDPYGQPWRMGADEATAFHTTVPVQIGDVQLEPGSYSIFGIPNPDQWTIVVNRNAERWGIPIDEGVRAEDVGEITVTPEATDAHVETLQYRFEPQGENAVDLVMEFENTRVRIPIQAAQG